MLFFCDLLRRQANLKSPIMLPGLQWHTNSKACLPSLFSLKKKKHWLKINNIMEGKNNPAASHLSSQKVQGECKGRVSFSLWLEIIPRFLSLMWMLRSSRTGLEDVLSCNAATGTAIVASEKTRMASSKKKRAGLLCRCFFGGVFFSNPGCCRYI